MTFTTRLRGEKVKSLSKREKARMAEERKAATKLFNERALERSTIVISCLDSIAHFCFDNPEVMLRVERLRQGVFDMDVAIRKGSR